jgi:CDP-glucose 4,6-dehydratase
MAMLWGSNANWVLDADPGVHEANYLKLDAGRAQSELAWRPQLDLETALHWLVDWYKAWQGGAAMHQFTLEQIATFDKQL